MEVRAVMAAAGRWAATVAMVAVQTGPGLVVAAGAEEPATVAALAATVATAAARAAAAATVGWAVTA